MGTMLSALNVDEERPEGRNAPADDASEAAPAAPKPKKAPSILDLSPKKMARRVVRWWESQNDLMASREAEWKVNRLRRRGIPNVRLVKEQDRGVWTAWAPPMTLASAPVANKAASLCRRAISYLLADPPQPDPVPASNEQDDIDAAELAERILESLQSESNLNEPKTIRRALGYAVDTASGFVLYYVDQDPAITTAKALVCSPQATEAATAVDEDGEPLGPPPYVTRYVTAAGLLTDIPKEAEQIPAVRLCRKIYQAQHVRFLPHDAEDLWDAEAVMIADFETWGALRKMLPALDALPLEEQKKIAQYRPDRAADLLPHRESETPQPRDETGPGTNGRDRPMPDETLVFTIKYYRVKGGDEPAGAYVLVLGNSWATGEPWEAEINGKVEALLIPLTQYRCLDEGRVDPYGVALMSLLGPGNEARSAQFGAYLEHLDRFGNRKTFLPINSIIRPEQLNQPMATPLPMNPGGEPKYEDIPDFPNDGKEMIAMTSSEMEEAAGLPPVAQGVSDPDVGSGKQASIMISQVHAGLSEWKQNIIDGYLRGCRIQLQQVRAKFTTPQLVGYTGDDGAYRSRAFVGTDLGDTRDVRLSIGSMTMLTSSQKAEQAVHYAQLQLPGVSGDSFREIIANNLGVTLGLEDQPERLRIKRQISAWKAGPPPGWQPPPPPLPPPPVGANAEGAVVASPVAPPPPPPDPILAAIFAEMPGDTIPAIALIRLFELQKLVSSVAYERKPLEWRNAIAQEFERMRLAAGSYTLQEQAAMQQPPQGSQAPGKSGAPAAGGGQPAGA